jgi:oxygen-independent coproporphyrinogen-3 oxidase
MEANPETVDETTLAGFLRAGAKRISFGVQAFQDRHLRGLGRIHSAAQARQAICSAQQIGFESIGADLMFGLPNQTMTDWDETLESALALPLNHVSCYELTVEDGTALSRSSPRLPDSDQVADMWEVAMNRLPAAGFAQYEIANYARDGHVCRHNMKYWLDFDFLGFGAGAWSCRHGTRFANPADIDKYLAGRATGFPPAQIDHIPPQVKMAETLILNLRPRQGCREDAFNARYGTGALEKFADIISLHIDAGRLERKHGYLRLTKSGMLVANSVWADLLAEAKAPPCEQAARDDRFFF